MDDIDDHLISILKTGLKLEAIKVYKDATGASLRDAIEYIENLEKGVSYQAPNLAGTSLDEQIIQLCNAGQKIDAIKRYRDATSCGLKEAKDYVDHLTDGTNETVYDGLAFERPAKKGFWQWLNSLLNGG